MDTEGHTMIEQNATATAFFTEADVEAAARHLALTHVTANGALEDYSWEATDRVWKNGFMTQARLILGAVHQARHAATVAPTLSRVYVNCDVKDANVLPTAKDNFNGYIHNDKGAADEARYQRGHHEPQAGVHTFEATLIIERRVSC
jgi:hypothetical protein